VHWKTSRLLVVKNGSAAPASCVYDPEFNAFLNKKPNFLPKEKFISNNESVVVKNIYEVTSVSWEADVSVTAPGKLNFYSLFFPGWKAYVNGREVDIAPGKSGQIVIDLNKGDTFVKVYWAETSLRKVADAMSVFFFLIVVGFFFVKHDDHRKIAAKNQK